MYSISGARWFPFGIHAQCASLIKSSHCWNITGQLHQPCFPSLKREFAYSERSLAWNREAEEIEYCRLLWIPPWCLLPFVPWASKSEVCCALNLENCQRSKEDGQVAYCCAALSSCNKLRESINLMELGPLALCSLLVIITQKIVQPKLS